MINRHPNRKEYIINVDSVHASTYTSSSDFVYTLPLVVRGVKGIEIMSGNVPPTSQPYLYFDINEIGEKKIYGPNRKYVSILRYELPAVATQNLITSTNTLGISRGDLKTLSQFTVKLYDRNEVTNSFGLDLLSAVSFSVASPTVITTTVAHTMVNGDVVHFRNILNASTNSLKETIENTPYVITNTGANTFTIPLNLLGEVTPSQPTGSVVAYALGSSTNVVNVNQQTTPVTLLTAHAQGTNVATAYAHGLQLNQRVRMYGCDNGATFADNDRINAHHIVVLLPSATDFVVSTTLSAYATPTQPTNTTAATVLGVGTTILVEKFQCSFDVRIVADMDILRKVGTPAHTRRGKIAY